MYPHIPHIPFHEAGHTGHIVIVAALPVIPHPVQVEQEADHEVPAQHHVAGVLNISFGSVTGDTLVLVHDIVHRQLDLPVLLFEDLFAETCIPQRNIQVIPFGTTRIDIIVEVGGKDKITLEGICKIGGIGLRIIPLGGSGADAVFNLIIGHIRPDRKIQFLLIIVEGDSLG